MKTLINKSSGQIIVVNKILRSEDKIIFTIYDNFIMYQNNQVLRDGVLPINKSIIPSELLAWDAYLEFISLATVLENYPDFVALDDPQGWCRPKGSDGEPTTIRVMLPYDLVAKETNTNSPLDQLVKGMAQLSPWLTRGEKSGVQYLQYLLPEHRYILDLYASSGVIVDNNTEPRFITIVFVSTSVDGEQVPVENAKVVIDGITRYTDSLGRCEISGLTNGDYVCNVYKDDVSDVVNYEFTINSNNIEFTVIV